MNTWCLPCCNKCNDQLKLCHSRSFKREYQSLRYIAYSMMSTFMMSTKGVVFHIQCCQCSIVVAFLLRAKLGILLILLRYLFIYQKWCIPNWMLSAYCGIITDDFAKKSSRFLYNECVVFLVQGYQCCIANILCKEQSLRQFAFL